MMSFAGSSNGGIDGLRPGHIRDLTSDGKAEDGIRLLDSISALINLFLSGQLSDNPRQIFSATNWTALQKKDGGMQPCKRRMEECSLAKEGWRNAALQKKDGGMQPCKRRMEESSLSLSETFSDALPQK